MPTTYYGSKDVVISFASNTLTAYFDPKGSIEREAILQNSTPFGVAWQAWLDTGSRKLAPLTLTGVERFEASTGCRSYLAEGSSGTFVVTYGGSKTTSVTCLVNKFTTIL
jgi:hypothetical protein